MALIITLVLLHLSVLPMIGTAPITGAPYLPAMSYLARYGYLDNPAYRNISLFDTFDEAVRHFQRFFGLKVSGAIDKDTVQAMETPRCGVGDTGVSKAEQDMVQVTINEIKKSSTKFPLYKMFFFEEIMDYLGSPTARFDAPIRWFIYRILKFSIILT